MLTRILSHNNISIEKVNLEYLKPLKSKLARLWVSYSNRKGSRGRQNLISNFEKTSYTLKVPHKTGSPTKRKIEREVETANAKVRKLEGGYNDVLFELDVCRNQLIESQRIVNKLSNPKKNRKGRGKAKNKQNYSGSQKRRHEYQKVDAIKDFLGSESSQSFLSIELKNEDGHTVKVALNQEEGSSKLPCKQNLKEGDTDKLIFIMDSYNVSDNAYHEIAQYCSALPRLCNVQKRRQELNSTFDIKTITGTYEGVFKSLKDHLMQTLSDPDNFSLFVCDDVIQIKLSGDGTRAGTKQHLLNVSYTVIETKTVPQNVETTCLP